MEKKIFKDIKPNDIIYLVDKYSLDLREVEESITAKGFEGKRIYFEDTIMEIPEEECGSSIYDPKWQAIFLYREDAVELLNKLIDEDLAVKQKEMDCMKEYMNKLLDKKEELMTQ